MTEDENPDRGGVNFLEKMIRKTFEIGPADVAAIMGEEGWIIPHRINSVLQLFVKFIS